MEELLIPLAWLEMTRSTVRSSAANTIFAERSLADDPHLRCHIPQKGKMRSRDLICRHILIYYNKYDRAYKCECKPAINDQKIRDVLLRQGWTDFAVYTLGDDR